MVRARVAQRGYRTPRRAGGGGEASCWEAETGGLRPDHAAVLGLQRRAGNAAVAGLIRQARGGGGGAATRVHDEPDADTLAAAPTGPRPADAEGDTLADAPSAVSVIPFDRAPLAAPGERIIFNSEFNDPSPSDYRLEYSTVGGHFTSASGPLTRTVAGLRSGNVDFFVPTLWDGTGTLSVTLVVRKTADSSAVRTDTWTFGRKERYPTTMSQQEDTGERALPGRYRYDIGPAVIPMRAPYYEHQTILERFGTWTLTNVEPDDIVDPYRTDQGLTTAAAVSAHFLGAYGGSNGTFTVNDKDQIRDRHGGHPDLRALVARLVAPKEIEVELPQTYEARPGTALGEYVVTRVLKADGTTWAVKKRPR
jgi:hypothetical protein